MSRQFNEPCPKVLQKPLLLFGFEELDLFIIFGILFILMSVKAHLGVVLGVGVILVIVFKYVKKGKPPKTLEWYIKWFFGAKLYSAVPMTIAESIKGRHIDPKLTSLQSLLPFESIENNILICADNSLTAGFELMCPDVGSYSSEDLIAHSNRIESLLNSLPQEGMRYQLFFTLDSNFEREIEQHKVIRSQNKLVQAIHKQRVNWFEAISKENLFRRRRCLFYVSYSGFKQKNRSTLKVLNPESSQKEAIKAMSSYYSQFEAIIGTIEQSLTGSGFDCHRMKKSELMAVFHKYLNPDRFALGVRSPKAKFKRNSLSQICCSDLKVDDENGEYLQYGGYYHKFISLLSLPESVYPAMLTYLTDMDFSEYDLSINFHIPTKAWAQKHLEQHRRRAYGSLHEMFGLENKDAKLKIQEIEYLIEELKNSDQKMAQMQLCVHVYSKNLELVKKRSNQVIRIFTELNGAEAHNERWGATLPVFIGSLPGWTKESSRQITLKTRQVADILPMFSQFHTKDRGECLFFNRSQGLVCHDLFSEDLDAYNSIVIGASGSGKSFVTQQIIQQYSKNEICEIYVDVGGSYHRHVELKGGSNIAIGLKSKFTLNLFDLPQGNTFSQLDDESKEEIINLKTNTIALMIGGFGQFEFGQIVEDYLAHSIRYLYQNVDYPELSDLKNALKYCAKHNKVWTESQDVIIGLLGIWFKGGQYGSFTDGKSTISMDNNVICFDLKGLNNFKKLQKVLFSVITNVIWSKVMGDKEKPKVVVFDEAWQLLASPEGASFISECYRTSRKYKFAVISISQSLEEFRSDKMLAGAILGNAHTLYILRQNNADAVENIVKFFKFNSQERRLIESLRIEKGSYSEVFLSQRKGMGNVRGVLRIYPTPLELWLATTNRDDVNYFEKVKKQYPKASLLKILEKCALKYPNGVKTSKNRKGGDPQ